MEKGKTGDWRSATPQNRWAENNLKTVVARLTVPEYELLRGYCEREGLSVHAAIKRALKLLTGEQASM